MKLRRVNPKSVNKPIDFSHLVVVDGGTKLLFISGQVSRNEKGEIVGRGDLEAQTRQVYRNLEAILKDVGATFRDVVKQNTYTTRPDQVNIIRKVRGEIFGQEPPASTIIGVPALANPDYLVEIEMIAATE